MESEMRMRLLVEEYSRLINLFQDIVQMRESMERLEILMIVMVVQIGLSLMVGAVIVCVKGICKRRKSGEYRLPHRNERRSSSEKKESLLTS